MDEINYFPFYSVEFFTRYMPSLEQKIKAPFWDLMLFKDGEIFYRRIIDTLSLEKTKSDIQNAYDYEFFNNCVYF